MRQDEAEGFVIKDFDVLDKREESDTTFYLPQGVIVISSEKLVLCKEQTCAIC